MKENNAKIPIIKYTRGEQLLDGLEIDIKEKYNIQSPQFIIKKKIEQNRKKIIEWMDKWLSYNKWIRYKRVKENGFELKEYFPNPPDDICLKKTDEFVAFYKNLRHGSLFWKIDSVIYDTKQAYKEIFFRIRNGYPELLAPGPIPDTKNRTIYDFEYYDDELGRIIPSGYMPLEQK